MSLCYNCFKEHNGSGYCPYCGYSERLDAGMYPFALAHGSILGGRFITGRVLGQGGFGITYVAQDHKNGKLVALKEYFPESLAFRTKGKTVSTYSGEKEEGYRYGLECFVSEAKTLSQFIGHPNIVRVYSYFQENHTAYFAMEYVEGISLKNFLKNRGGKITLEETKLLVAPVMDALQVIHSKGIIHRDVSPDNIYLTKTGTVKLIDFGAARYSLGDRSRSLDIVLKHGYAPMEQYARRGRQGPYTDVYSLGATIYRCITGIIPPDSVDRVSDDAMKPPSALGVPIPRATEKALLKAMAVLISERYQTMAQFKFDFIGPIAPPRRDRVVEQKNMNPPYQPNDPRFRGNPYPPQVQQGQKKQKVGAAREYWSDTPEKEGHPRPYQQNSPPVSRSLNYSGYAVPPVQAYNRQQPYPQQPRSVTPAQPYVQQPRSVTPPQPYPQQPRSVTPQQPYPQQPRSATPPQPYVQQPRFATPPQPYAQPQRSVMPPQPFAQQPQFAATPSPIKAVRVPTPEMQPVPEIQPGFDPHQTFDPEQVFVAQPASSSEPVPEPQPEPVMQPEPIVEPQPIPASELAVEAEPISEPMPEPVPAPEPLPAPEPVIEPEPLVEAEPAFTPEPAYQPEAYPVPAQEYIPEPTAQPEPAYEPQAVHEPVPAYVPPAASADEQEPVTVAVYTPPYYQPAPPVQQPLDSGVDDVQSGEEPESPEEKKKQKKRKRLVLITVIASAVVALAAVAAILYMLGVF